MEQASQTPRRPRRDKRRERNRRQLIDATIELVAQGGSGALTVSRVSRAAGMEPPNFYAHFKSVEECEAAAAEELEQYLQRKLQPYSRVQTSHGLDEAQRWYAALLASWLEEPRWLRILLRARNEDSPIGRRMRGIVDRVRADTWKVLWELSVRRGMKGVTHAEIEMLADLCVGHFTTAFHALAEGRTRDVDAAAAAIARANRALIGAEFRRIAARAAPDG